MDAHASLHVKELHRPQLLWSLLADHGKREAAIEQFHKSLEIQPNYAKAHKSLAQALAGNGDEEGAPSIIERRCKSSRTMPRPTCNLELHWPAGNIDTAIEHFRRAIEIEPELAEAHYNLGLGLAHRGQFDAAFAEFQKSLEFNPSLAEAEHNLGTIFAGRKQFNEAVLRIFEKRQRSNPISPMRTTTLPWP